MEKARIKPEAEREVPCCRQDALGSGDEGRRLQERQLEVLSQQMTGTIACREVPWQGCRLKDNWAGHSLSPSRRTKIMQVQRWIPAGQKERRIEKSQDIFKR